MTKEQIKAYKAWKAKAKAPVIINPVIIDDKKVMMEESSKITKQLQKLQM